VLQGGLVHVLMGTAAVVLLLAGCGGDAATPRATGAPTQAADLPAGMPEPPGDAFGATVERVVDGDTFVAVRDGRRVRVRLIGVDAPESVKPDAPVECYGREASALLTRLLPGGGEVRAAYQTEQHRDPNGRDLWDVWLPTGGSCKLCSYATARPTRAGTGRRSRTRSTSTRSSASPGSPGGSARQLLSGGQKSSGCAVESTGARTSRSRRWHRATSRRGPPMRYLLTSNIDGSLVGALSPDEREA
jgi:micrococcal nuclease